MQSVETKSGVLLVNRRTAADMLGISERSLFDLTANGTIPAIRLNQRNVRYSVKALEEFVAKQVASA